MTGSPVDPEVFLTDAPFLIPGFTNWGPLSFRIFLDMTGRSRNAAPARPW
jgi:hypothetical protein